MATPTKNKSQHTKGEWKLNGTQIFISDGYETEVEIAITDFDQSTLGKEVCLANAKRIVKCVNMYDKLIVRLCKADEIYRDQWKRMVLTKAEHDEWNRVKELLTQIEQD